MSSPARAGSASRIAAPTHPRRPRTLILSRWECLLLVCVCCLSGCVLCHVSPVLWLAVVAACLAHTIVSICWLVVFHCLSSLCIARLAEILRVMERQCSLVHLPSNPVSHGHPHISTSRRDAAACFARLCYLSISRLLSPPQPALLAPSSRLTSQHTG